MLKNLLNSKIFLSRIFIFLTINTIIVAFQIFIVSFFYSQMNSEIPLWYTKNWGLEVLAPKEDILVIPFISVLLSITSIFVIQISKKLLQFKFENMFFTFTTIGNLVLTYSLVNIVKKTTYSNLFFLDFIGTELLNSFFISLVLSFALTPLMLGIFRKYGLITDPKKHQHPGMILKQPSVRGGGVVFAISFTISSLLLTKPVFINFAIIGATLLASIIGILDDISNTSSNKSTKIFGNPIFRLLVLLPIPALILVFSGVRIEEIGIPFSENILNLNQYFWLPYIFSIIWILWIANLLSWSNGVDGQYGGIVGVAGIVIGVLALRFINITDKELDVAKMALICSGAALGLIPFTWHPSKIMWGFGATSAGICLAALSILSLSKISISILVLLVPFMDGLITIIRRIINKQNPFKGDRGHLHHLLLNRGWSIGQIAVFYWLSTMILGLIAIYSSEKDLPLLILTLGGIVSFFIITLNLKLDKK